MIQAHTFGGGSLAESLAAILNETDPYTARKACSLLAQYDKLVEQIGLVSDRPTFEYLLQLVRADYLSVKASGYPNALRTHMKNYIVAGYRKALAERGPTGDQT